jgi:hypothetical protein
VVTGIRMAHVGLLSEGWGESPAKGFIRVKTMHYSVSRGCVKSLRRARVLKSILISKLFQKSGARSSAG